MCASDIIEWYFGQFFIQNLYALSCMFCQNCLFFENGGCNLNFSVGMFNLTHTKILSSLILQRCGAFLVSYLGSSRCCIKHVSWLLAIILLAIGCFNSLLSQNMHLVFGRKCNGFLFFYWPELGEDRGLL